MKTVHYCDVCGKDFPTPEEALACEKRHEEEKARKEALAKTRDDRANEIREDYKALSEKYEQYFKDYGVYPNLGRRAEFSNPFDRIFSMIL